LPPVRRPNLLLRTTATLSVGALLLGLGLLARDALGLAWNVASLRDLVLRMGLWGPAGFVLLVGFRTFLMLPSQLVLTAAGLCFGVLLGTAIGTLGLLVSGGWAFGLARWLGPDTLHGRLPARIHKAVALAGSRGGAALVALGTGYPFGPTTAYHAAAGLTPMRALRFFTALGLGGMVRSGTFAFFGNSVAERSLAHVALSLGILGMALLPLAHPAVRRWVRRQFGMETQSRLRAPSDEPAPGPSQPRPPKGNAQADG
jgi:Uncharacterized conserved protein